MPAKASATLILLDGGDPEETLRISKLLGFLDGQTTNPTLIAKSPEVRERIAKGDKLTQAEQQGEYKHIVQEISPLVGSAGVSIEVFADLTTTAEEMLAQGEEMFSWIPNAYIKYPCIHEGLRAAKMSVERNIRVNMTLCFSQSQAAAVYAATKGSRYPVYISPFIGRLDDGGENGMDLVRSIKKMYQAGDGHVHVLAASLRRRDHLLGTLALGVELVTAPAHVLEQWVAADFTLPSPDFQYRADVNGKRLRLIPYREIDLNASWESFDLRHDLTDKGVRKFVEDYKSTLAPAA